VSSVIRRAFSAYHHYTSFSTLKFFFQLAFLISRILLLVSSLAFAMRLRSARNGRSIMITDDDDHDVFSGAVYKYRFLLTCILTYLLT